jgi:hypothetical protein
VAHVACDVTRRAPLRQDGSQDAARPALEVVGMSVEKTQRTLDRYFGLMGRDEDFAECFTADVTWVIADTGR